MTTSFLYPTHTDNCKVPQFGSAFQTQIQPQRPGRYSNASQRRASIGRWVKIKIADIEYPFEHGEVITLWMVYQYTHSLQRHRHPSKLSFRRGKKPLRDSTMRPMATLKQLQCLIVRGEN